MESHILNTYHQAHYRIDRHTRVGSTSESCSSESSCPQNSPEYPAKFAPRSGQAEGWEGNPDTKVSVKAEDSSESSSDEDETPDDAQVQQTASDNDPHESSELVYEEYYSQEVVPDSDEDYEIVVDDEAQNEGPIIQVYAVDPNLDLEASEDDDYCIPQEADGDVDVKEEYYIPEEENEEEEEEYYIPEKEDDDEEKSDEDEKYAKCPQNVENVQDQHIGINLDAPVFSNVDEYLIKKNKEAQILEVKDHPVVADVDEYFIKDDKKAKVVNTVSNLIPQENTISNVDEFFVKNRKVKKEIVDLNIVGDVPNVDEFFNKVVENTAQKNPDKAETETDSDILPHIEHIKRFLLEDMPCPKFQSKSVQRSCSLPHSPVHISYLDVDDARTSLSFEDLNLDLTDFTFSDDSKVDKTNTFNLSVDSGNKSDDIPRTLTEEDVNSFLITIKPDAEDDPAVANKEDDLNSEDMEIECPIEAKIECSVIEPIDKPVSNSTAMKVTTVLGFCIEKPMPEIKVRKDKEVKVEVDDFVDVESLNDTVIPVLAANNVSSLLEQFEATEKINTSTNKRRPQFKTEPKEKANGLANGTRLQDAAVQLNKNKIRQILMSTPGSSPVVKKSSQTVHSDHDYCSPKKRHSLPTSLSVKGGQSLLKPEVLSSNNKILNSRHRSCKNKKVVYHMSSDDEGENNERNNSSVKPSVKAPLSSNHRKKLSPPPPATTCKSNISVISNNASKASDTNSQSSSGSIKLTIKNKSKVILKIDCDDKKDSQKCVRSKDAKTSDFKNVKGEVGVKPCDALKSSESIHQSDTKPMEKLMNLMDEEKKLIQKSIKQLDSNKNKIEANSIGNYVCTNVIIKEEPRPIKEDFYTALFQNKKDIQINLPEPVIVKSETKTVDSSDNKDVIKVTNVPNVETKPIRKKLNLQEYKLRKEGVNSNGSSRTVSPEAIFPDMPGLLIDKTISQMKPQISPPVNEKPLADGPKEPYDPIREASRKIIANTKKQKAIDATRKRDEDIVMSKIPKVENLKLQPLISDAEMMKIVGMASEILPVAAEKPKLNKDYEELVLFSVGTNTDQAIFRQLRKAMENEKRRSKSPEVINEKNMINFKIKKSENILKQNVFDSIKNDRKTPDAKRPTSPIKQPKIDKKRYKEITATIKSVEKQTKICSNSLFASIQDVVMKKAPDEVVHRTPEKPTEEQKTRKLLSPVQKSAPFFKPNARKTKIVREYDTKNDHGEDKIIFHLKKNRTKPGKANMVIQTDPSDDFIGLASLAVEIKQKQLKDSSSSRKRTASDMSVSSDKTTKSIDKKVDKTEKHKSEERRTEKRSRSLERNSRSKDRYRRRTPSRIRRSSSRSRRVRRRSRRSRSRSRCRSRSLERYIRYRRSDSPYRRRKRSTSYRRSLSRRSHSKRRDYCSNRTRTRSRSRTHRSRSPVNKKVKCTQEKEPKSDQSLTPPMRKPTISESSDSSTSSSSSSSASSRSSASTDGSRSRSRSSSPLYRKYRSYSSEARGCTTPVEERRIVFVGKLENEATKSSLRSQLARFGHILAVTLHRKKDGSRYGFVTFSRARDAWSAVEGASHFPQYDVGFGGRRAFCRQRYADLDGISVKYAECSYLPPPAPAPALASLSFEQMLRDVKHQLSRRKGEAGSKGE